MSELTIYDDDRMTLAGAVSLLEWRLIERALHRHKYHLSATARALDITRTTLRAKMKKHQIRNQPMKETPA